MSDTPKSDTPKSDTPKIKIDLAKLRAAQPKPPGAPQVPAAQTPAEASQALAAPVTAPEPPRPKVESYRPLVDASARLSNLDKDLDREIEAAMGGMSALDLYGDLSKPQPPPAAGEGGQKKGRVVRVHGDDVFVEVPGGRAPGMISLQQFPDGAPAVGSEVDVHIEGYDPANGLLRLTRKGAAQHVDWSSVAEGMIVEARVTEVNKGGLAVEVNGIRGFMPISQIELFRVEDLNPYINQRLRCLVTEVNPAERNLVVSRRALLDKEREENREKLWNVLAEGQVYTGIVRSVKDFGAFIDLGGVDGLLHVGEMSWQRVQDAASVVQPGQSVKVVVLKLDRERRKVSLGMKQLQASPWDAAVDNYAIGSVVKGKVTRLMEFGAFVELEPGIEGLIHISELAPQRVRRVSDIVKPEQEVQVMVLSLEPGQRRIGLSLKAALPKEEAPAEEEAEEEEVEVKPPRPRTTPLRGGIGDQYE
jgi:small subunit ribosomal protein S1